MHKQFTRTTFLFWSVVAFVVLNASAVLAGSASVSGTFSPDDSVMPVISVSTPNCTGQGATPVRYHRRPFTVSADGNYTFTLTQTVPVGGLVSLYLHSSGFNPANGFPTCLAATNSGPGATGFTETLSAGTTYIAVPFDDTFSQRGGSYTLTISGPGDVTFLQDAEDDIWSGFQDGRLNKYDAGATFVVYCTDSSVELYALDGSASGSLAYVTTQAEIDIVDSSAANTLIKESNGVRLFKLTSGELQFVGAPDAEGKVYNVIFDAFPCTLVRSFFN